MRIFAFNKGAIVVSRNRYAKELRMLERKRLAQQEGELAAIDRRLRSQAPDPMEVLLLNEDKVRRSARLEQKRQRKTKRCEGSGEADKKWLIPVRVVSPSSPRPAASFRQV